VDTSTVTDPVHSNALFALPYILQRGRFSRSHLYNLVARGHFPKPCIVMGPRFTRWSAATVNQYFGDPVKWIADHKCNQKEAA
jgi:predicted DNA-binding transcriptional regulator AlpA